MGWQGMLKLYFMLFLPRADPEILPHIWKIALCNNTYKGFQPSPLCYSRLQPFISRNCWHLYRNSLFGWSSKYQGNIIVVWRLWSLIILQLISPLLFDWTADPYEISEYSPIWEISSTESSTKFVCIFCFCN